jgi:hypothetical protein
MVIDAIRYYPAIDQQSVRRIAELLSNDQADVQIAAAFTLTHFGDEAQSAIPALIALHARHISYPESAYDALAQMSDRARRAMLADRQPIIATRWKRWAMDGRTPMAFRF